jgi:hypothetical protein
MQKVYYGVVCGSVALSCDGPDVFYWQGMNVESVVLDQLPGTGTPDNCWLVTFNQLVDDIEPHVFQATTQFYDVSDPPPSIVAHVFSETQAAGALRQVRVYLTDGGSGAAGAGGFDIPFSAQSLGHNTSPTDFPTGYAGTTVDPTLRMGWRVGADVALSVLTVRADGDDGNPIGSTVKYEIFLDSITTGKFVTLDARSSDEATLALSPLVRCSQAQLVTLRATPSTTLSASPENIVATIATEPAGGGSGAIVLPVDFGDLDAFVDLVMTRTNAQRTAP